MRKKIDGSTKAVRRAAKLRAMRLRTRAIVYIGKSMAAKEAYRHDQIAIHELDLELGLPGDPKHLANAKAMQICIGRLHEVLESAP